MAEVIKELRCDVCGLESENGEIVSRNGKSYHSKCVKGLMEHERESRRNALKVIGIGTAIAGATLLGADRLASASFTRPIGGGGVYSSPFVLPGLFSDPSHPEPGHMRYRMDKGVTAFHDGIINRNIYSKRNQHVITVLSNALRMVFPQYPMLFQTSGWPLPAHRCSKYRGPA